MHDQIIPAHSARSYEFARGNFNSLLTLETVQESQSDHWQRGSRQRQKSRSVSGFLTVPGSRTWANLKNHRHDKDLSPLACRLLLSNDSRALSWCTGRQRRLIRTFIIGTFVKRTPMFESLRFCAFTRPFTFFLGGIAVLMASLAAHASVVYTIDRTIGSGTVQGTITTDGTTGVLSNGNIESWAITVAHPNLSGGSPYTLSSIGIGLGRIWGDALTATATDLVFDFRDPQGGNFYLFDSVTYWCNISLGGCGNSDLASTESVGFLNSLSLPFEQTHRGAVTIASVANVPEPGSLALFGLALAGLAATRRRKQ